MPATKRHRILLGLACSLAMLGCGPAAPRPAVPVSGLPGEVARLAGEWQGDYWSVETGRRGSIHFSLAVDGISAQGQVSMVPAFRPAAAGREGRRGGSEALSIRFVRTADGTVSGTLDPYRDPDCNCKLSTRFTGVLDGDHIAGTYTTTGPLGHAETHGRWQATRVRAAPR